MNHNLIKDILIQIGESVCKKVHQSLKEQTVEERSAVFKEGEDDTIYRIDRDVEEVLVPILEKNARQLNGIVLVAEGIGENTNGVVLPHGKRAESASLRIIMDPIDGTRGIMYDKRSAFFWPRPRQTKERPLPCATLKSPSWWNCPLRAATSAIPCG